MISAAQVDAWLQADEDGHLEFKEAKTSFDPEKLTRYCAALANEGGGRLVFGVTDRRPRRVVGSAAFASLGRTVHRLLQQLRLRIVAEEVDHPDGRVVVFTIPSRPIGAPIETDGRYLMRSGESLTGMTPEMLRAIFDEGSPDYSAETCPAASIEDLDPAAIEKFRTLWRRKSGRAELDDLPAVQLLEDAELLVDGGVTYAALILMGTRRALGRHLAQAELVFEYRSEDLPGPAAQRAEFRQGFLGWFDELWELIDRRNDKQSYQDGLLVWDISTFNERACREAILNAVSHRDFRDAGSVFVRQYPRRLVVESPGGFPEGITEDNLLYRQKPRNRRLADALARCGFVERSGQGADMMFRTCIEEGKARPDFRHTDDHGVFLTLHGEVRDPDFVHFLEKVSRESGLSFGVNELLVLAHVHDGERVPQLLHRERNALLEAGVLERVARRKLVLSRRFYRFVGRPGEYTRRRGLDHETNKELLLRHIRDAGDKGARMSELLQVLPSKTRNQIQAMLKEMKEDRRVTVVGRTRAARWFACGDAIPTQSTPRNIPQPPATKEK